MCRPGFVAIAVTVLLTFTVGCSDASPPGKSGPAGTGSGGGADDRVESGGSDVAPADDVEPVAPAPPIPEDQVEFTNTVEMTFRRIGPGAFVMGGSGGPAYSPLVWERGDDRRSEIGEPGDDATPFNTPAHEVEIEHAFYMGTTEVTQAQYEAVMGENPSLLEGDDLPVHRVSWHDAVAFCEELSDLEGRTYRLPTEAEWEYACRAGATTRFYWGDDPEVASEYARFTEGVYPSRAVLGTPGYGPDPVGSYEPNAWGLYDMYGNVSEWCEDWADYYPESEETQPDYEMETYRIIRSGSWQLPIAVLGSALRFDGDPDWSDTGKGFRVVLEAE